MSSRVGAGAARRDRVTARQRRIRVMYVVPDLRFGGAERHAVDLMRHLDTTRFDASVVCIGDRGALFDDLAPGVHAVALHRSKRQALRAVSDLVREMRQFAPDVVLTRGYNAETLGRIAARLAGVPHSVVWVHNHGDTVPRGRARRAADRALDRVTSAYFGVAHAQTDYLTTVLGYPADKIRVLHNGVDPHRFDDGDDRSALRGLPIGDGDKVVGTFAMLRPEKDHHTLVRAARKVVDRLPDTRFLIVGDGAERPAIERLVDELDLAEHVLLTGARSDVPALLRATDVFALSSATVECFPISLLEAMAAGRPAVCTAVGGVPEMVQDGVTGHLVPPRDPDTLAEQLTSVLSDGDRARRMGRAARTRVENEFSLQSTVAATERALIDLVGGVPRSRPLHLTVVLDVTFVGGVELLLLDVFKHLDPDVVVPRLVCLREPGPLAADFRAAGFEVEVLDRSGRFDARTLPRLVASLRRARADAVLVTHHHRAALALGRIAARLARVPVNVLAAHDMDLVATGKRVLPRWAVHTLALSDALVLLSRRQGTYLRREEGVGDGWLTTTREVVIPNGIALPPPTTPTQRAQARTLLGSADGDFVVGIVARLSPQKAHEVLFEAVALCAFSLPQLRLVVIGDGERAGQLRELALRLGIAGRTSFLGTRRDVARLLPGLDVACLSSVHEGVPITLIEAMAAGVPIVATDCGAVRDVVSDGENGFVVPVGDVLTYADRLRRLAGDPVMRDRFGRTGRHRAEAEFRVETTARRYEELLTDAVARKG